MKFRASALSPTFDARFRTLHEPCDTARLSVVAR